MACGKEPTPRATFTATSIDFGTVIEGTPLEPEFVVKNTGDAPLRIERVNMTAPVKVLVKKMPAQIAPGAEAVIRLSIDTTAGLGPVDGEVAVMLNDPAQPEARLGLQGHIVGRVEVAPNGALYVAAGRASAPKGPWRSSITSPSRSRSKASTIAWRAASRPGSTRSKRVDVTS